MIYQITSDKAQVIDGLGVFEEGQSRSFTQGDIDWFEMFRGVSFVDSLPEGVEVVVDMTGGEN